MTDVLKAVLLGIIEGVTEFLPISSTGHLIITAAVLDFAEGLKGTFEVFIQIGAVFAVLVHYCADIREQMRTVRHDSVTQRFWLDIMIASLPPAIIGFFLRDVIKSALFTPEVVAAALVAGGILFIVVERRLAAPAEAQSTHLNTITARQALAIGLAQTLALVPGVSRSGASIVGGMLAGLNRRTATQFSFYLAIPLLGGATLFDLATSLDTLGTGDILLLLVATAVSGAVSWLAIGWLIRYVSRNSLVAFGYYRIVIGVFILFLAAVGAF